MKQKLTYYVQLMRLHRPVGIWLLYWPCVWSLFAALRQAEDASRLGGMLVLFGVGSLVMRGAGCVVNDMTDRKLDAHVARTRTRPLASGVVSMREAVGLVVVLLCIALAIAVALGWKMVVMGAAWLPLIAAYPWMKRLTWWPQAFLGITFNAGALFGWVAMTGGLELAPVMLYLAGIFWTLGYDTLYAMQDREDDTLIGIRSTARRFGAYVLDWVAGFYVLSVLCLLLCGMLLAVNTVYYLGVLLFAAHLVWQCLVASRHGMQEGMYGNVFRSNTLAGAFVAMAFALAYV